MSKLLGDLTVVGEHQDSGSVLVESSDRENTHMATLDQVHDGLLRMGIASAGDVALGLVHDDVYLLLTLESLSVETDIVLKHINLGSELGHDLTIDGHDSGLDQGVSLATGADS